MAVSVRRKFVKGPKLVATPTGEFMFMPDYTAGSQENEFLSKPLVFKDPQDENFFKADDRFVVEDFQPAAPDKVSKKKK